MLPPLRGNVLATDLEIGDNGAPADGCQVSVLSPSLSLGTQASHRSPDSEVPSINFVPVPSSELSARSQKITCSPAITQKLKLVTIDSIKILDKLIEHTTCRLRRAFTQSRIIGPHL